VEYGCRVGVPGCPDVLEKLRWAALILQWRMGINYIPDRVYGNSNLPVLVIYGLVTDHGHRPRFWVRLRFVSNQRWFWSNADLVGV